MKFSTRAEYGLKAVINLALAYPAQKSIAEISREERVSVKYLEKLMGQYRKKGLVKSTKGKTGGYSLSKSPAKIRVAEIIETAEGSLSPMKCAESVCHLSCGCISAKVWVKLGKEIRKTLNGIILSDLIAR